jgi:hypothetical protein
MGLIKGKQGLVQEQAQEQAQNRPRTGHLFDRKALERGERGEVVARRVRRTPFT